MRKPPDRDQEYGWETEEETGEVYVILVTEIYLINYY